MFSWLISLFRRIFQRGKLTKVTIEGCPAGMTQERALELIRKGMVIESMSLQGAKIEISFGNLRVPVLTKDGVINVDRLEEILKTLVPPESA